MRGLLIVNRQTIGVENTVKKRKMKKNYFFRKNLLPFAFWPVFLVSEVYYNAYLKDTIFLHPASNVLYL